MRTYEQMRQEREETERPIVITEHEWWIVQNHWLKEDERGHEVHR